MFSNLPKVLILGAIAAASAFVVTILIVLVCVGCQRKSKSKHGHTNGGAQKKETASLRQSKLNSMSKSDTRLHDMHRLPCNANGAPKSRPASMDLLLLHTRRSTSDLRPSPGRQLPRALNKNENEREHTYSEVCRRSSPTSLPPDDGLYESVGIKGVGPDKPAPPAVPALTSTSTPSQRRALNPTLNGNGRGGSREGMNGVSQDEVTAEYASIRKVRKLERGRREEVVEDGEREHQSMSSSESSSSTLPRKTVEPFHLPNFPKEAVFMGNGEQYIWKPPEEDEMIMPGVPQLENGHSHPTAVEISDMYSTVCKTLKRKHQQGQSQEDSRPAASAASQEVERGSTGWPAPGAAGEDSWRRCSSQEEPCYEPVGEKTWPRGLAQESDPAYATIDSHRKREKLACNTLKPRKKPTQGPGRAMTCENFYETIGDVKQGASAASTTTIFTFNDGMEMYVTGL
uniref:Lck-interacting transmembrane adapter 1 n=1 Tax=Cyprinus carpio TaxID=7962 RepID=A0A8C1KW62_CYPCA